MHQFTVVEHEVLHRHHKVQRFIFFLVTDSCSLLSHFYPCYLPVRTSRSVRLNKYKVDLPPCVQRRFCLRVFWNCCVIRNLAVVFNWKRTVECNTSDDDSSVLTITNRQNIYPPVCPSLLGAT